jgi:hypothetical protein
MFASAQVYKGLRAVEGQWELKRNGKPLEMRLLTSCTL